MKSILDMRICPGCGTESPKSQSEKYFSCRCGWEIDRKTLPTIGDFIAEDHWVCNDVDVSALIRKIINIESAKICAKIYALSEEFDNRARNQLRDAEHDADSIVSAKRMIEHGATCYANAAQEIRDVLINHDQN